MSLAEGLEELAGDIRGLSSIGGEEGGSTGELAYETPKHPSKPHAADRPDAGAMNSLAFYRIAGHLRVTYFCLSIPVDGSHSGGELVGRPPGQVDAHVQPSKAPQDSSKHKKRRKGQ